MTENALTINQSHLTRSLQIRLLFRRLPFPEDVEKIIFEYLFTDQKKRIFKEICTWLSCSVCNTRLFNEPYDIRRKGFFVDNNDYDDYMFQRKFKKYYKNPTLSFNKKYVRHVCDNCTSCWCIPQKRELQIPCRCQEEREFSDLFHQKNLKCRCVYCITASNQDELEMFAEMGLFVDPNPTVGLFVIDSEIKKIN